MKNRDSREFIASLPRWLKILLVLGLLSGVMAAIMMPVVESKLSHARAEVVNFLDQTSISSMVKLNGSTVSNSQELISILRGMADLPAHHSHASYDRIRVEVETADSSLMLELGRDSQFRDEYWIFYPKHYFANLNEIGRIRTRSLDHY